MSSQEALINVARNKILVQSDIYIWGPSIRTQEVSQKTKG
jgi:hypothetical protein